MKEQDIYRSVRRVYSTKVIVIILGIVLIIAGFVMLMGGAEGWSALIGMGIGCFLTGGLIEGFAEIVQAACKYNNTPDTSAESAEVIDDADVQ
jgi:hypothetical protein